MTILITNDDGMHADQLLPLIRWCQKLGEVTVFVPKVEQSGKSHSFEIRNPFEVKQVQLAPDVTIWSVDSTPADCVRFAVLGQKKQFDLVISGINRGYNIGTDTLYSGTVAAVSEAGIIGLPAIALSTTPGYYEHAVEHLDTVWAYIQEHRLLEQHSLYNINIPPEPKGVRITRQGGSFYSDDFVLQEDDMYMPKGILIYENKQDLTLDTDCVHAGFISVMPLTINKTDVALYEKLKDLNN